MKYLSFVIALTLVTATSFAQNCASKHAVFKVPQGVTPKVMKVLGTSPEFPPLQNRNSRKEIFHNLKAMGESAKYKDAINSLFVALGYTGVLDPAFTLDDVTAGNVPFGSIGMLGDAAHHYEYSILVLPGEQIIKSWHIRSRNGCDLNFMSRCGNAFYMTSSCPGNPTNIKVVARTQVNSCNCNLGEDDPNETGYPFHPSSETETKVIAEEAADRNANTQTIYLDVDKATYRKLTKE
jgi:hypothetical protein